MEKDKVVLVNEQDEAVGVAGKLEAHQKGLLHRAFSILIFDDCNNMLIQRRALNKYHTPGLWSNTVCSHPYPNESIIEAANRRLVAEMGFTCPIYPLFNLVYKSSFSNGLIEHEFDHVLTGKYTGPIFQNPVEVFEYKWVNCTFLKEDVLMHPAIYTPWFCLIIAQLNRYIDIFQVS